MFSSRVDGVMMYFELEYRYRRLFVVILWLLLLFLSCKIATIKYFADANYKETCLGFFGGGDLF